MSITSTDWDRRTVRTLFVDPLFQLGNLFVFGNNNIVKVYVPSAKNHTFQPDLKVSCSTFDSDPYFLKRPDRDRQQPSHGGYPCSRSLEAVARKDVVKIIESDTQKLNMSVILRSSHWRPMSSRPPLELLNKGNQVRYSTKHVYVSTRRRRDRIETHTPVKLPAFKWLSIRNVI
jgi:hypothetical protein